MDKDSRELAISAFGMLNEHLSPEYLQARQDLISRLALSDVNLDTLQGKMEGDTHNGEVITSFCVTLPSAVLRPHGYSSIARIESPFIDELALQQASVVFVNTNFDRPYLPYYVVGINKKDGRILLAPPSFIVPEEKYEDGEPTDQAFLRDKLQDQLLIATFTKGNRRAIKNAQKVEEHLDVLKKLYMEGAPAYADDVFNKRMGVYTIDYTSPGSFTDINYTKYYKFEHATYLSDTYLVDFEVMDHLSRLALAFNHGADLLKALGEKIEKATEEKSGTSS
ncbi:MAG TPA: hypothetical protein VLG13_00510 [Patescibacteria group bacterium]|nr:hypothetical protein [Patescibacteria group bacterium]